MRTVKRSWMVALVFGLSALSASRSEGAFLTGSSVTGSLQFPLETNFPNNYFDPANGFVPAGFGNSAPGGPTVIIATPAVEFGFDNLSGLTHTADFSDSSLVLTTVGAYDAFTMTFTDTAFAGATVTLASDSYSGATTFTLVGDVLTINQAADSGLPGPFTATFNFTSSAVPEPSSLALCGIAGLTGLGMAWKRRRRVG